MEDFEENNFVDEVKSVDIGEQSSDVSFWKLYASFRYIWLFSIVASRSSKTCEGRRFQSLITLWEKKFLSMSIWD